MPDHLVAHRHTHFHHSGDIAQKFVIHGVFLCRAIGVIIADREEIKSGTGVRSGK
jgi:hypothetical protein